MIDSTNYYKRAVGFVLRQLRAKAGVTLDFAAAAMDMNRSHLTSLEGGNHAPTRKTLLKLADFYGLTLLGLVGLFEAKAASYRRRKPT